MAVSDANIGRGDLGGRWVIIGCHGKQVGQIMFDNKSMKNCVFIINQRDGYVLELHGHMPVADHWVQLYKHSRGNESD